MIELKGKFAEAKVYTDLIDNASISQLQEMINHEITENTKVRIMPDVHAGKGSTIGTTIKLPENLADWKVCPNIVGIDVGCFTGDTKVRLADGRSLSFLELVSEYEQGKDNYIYGIKDGEVEISKLSKPRKTNVVNELAYVTLDNGEIIKCTTDHNFIMRNGEEVEAKHLKDNMSLMPLYVEFAEDVKDNLRDYNLSKITKGMGRYHAIYMPSENDYIMAHVLADNYNYKNDMTLKDKTYDEGRKSFVRHHKDFDKYNNTPPNVERMGFKEHWKVHADSIRETNAMGLTGFSRAIELNPDLPSRAGSLRAKATWNGPNAERNYKNQAERMRKMNESGIMNSEEQRESLRQRQLTNNTNKFHEQNKDPEFILVQRISRYARIAQECVNKHGKLSEEGWETTRMSIAKNSPKYSSLPTLLEDANMSIDELLNIELKERINHKVVNVEIKSVNPTDVYCLTNFEHGNFALDAGVFVNNCGILMYQLNDKDIDLERLDNVVNASIPAGFNVHDKIQDLELTSYLAGELSFEMVPNQLDRIHKSLGTLGGGNHFIELGIDEENNYWLSVHSGSRNLGVQVGKTHQDIAIQLAKNKIINGEGSIKEVIEKLKSEGKHKEIEKAIKNLKKNNQKLTVGQKNLTYLSGDKLKDYLNDMAIAQKYAVKNRETMLDIIVEAMGFEIIDKFDSIHNFIEHNNFENGILRKGATSAKKGERLVIPLNMRDGSLICVGKGNDDWNQSAPHGAGRIMSRAQAKQNINLKTLNEQMRDVYSSTISINTIDEGPDAYKPADIIKENIKDTADIIHQVKPIYNYKG